MPGRSARIEYVPEPLVTVERVFSISAGLETSTVTPGSTPPDASLTVPVIVLVCAEANDRREDESEKYKATYRERTHHKCLPKSPPEAG